MPPVQRSSAVLLNRGSQLAYFCCANNLLLAAADAAAAEIFRENCLLINAVIAKCKTVVENSSHSQRLNKKLKSNVENALECGILWRRYFLHVLVGQIRIKLEPHFVDDLVQPADRPHFQLQLHLDSCAEVQLLATKVLLTRTWFADFEIIFVQVAADAQERSFVGQTDEIAKQ